MNFLNIFIAPPKVGKDILKKNSFPWVLLVITALIPVIAFVISYDQTRELLVAQLKAQYATLGQTLTADTLESLIGVSMISAMVMSVLASLGGWMVFSLLLFLFAGFQDSEGSFKQTLSLVGYANLITGILTLITAVLAFAGVKGVDFSPVVFISKQATPSLFMTGLLQSFNIFRIWKYVAIGLGFSSFLEKKGAAISLTVIMFIICTAVTVVPLLFVPASVAAAMA